MSLVFSSLNNPRHTRSFKIINISVSIYSLAPWTQFNSCRSSLWFLWQFWQGLNGGLNAHRDEVEVLVFFIRRKLIDHFHAPCKNALPTSFLIQGKDKGQRSIVERDIPSLSTFVPNFILPNPTVCQQMT